MTKGATARNVMAASDDARARFMARIRRDHAQISRVLGAITALLYAVWNRPDETLPILREALRYLTTFQDAYHHPAEDVMYDRLLRRCPKYKLPLRHLRRDHVQVTRTGAALAVALEGTGTNAPRWRLQFLAQMLETYAEQMRRHMADEEKLIYERAENALEPEDWREIHREVPPADPLADPRKGMAQDYPELFQFFTTLQHSIPTYPDPLGDMLRGATKVGQRVADALALLAQQTNQASQLAAACLSLIRPRTPVRWLTGGIDTAWSNLSTVRSWIDEWQALVTNGPARDVEAAMKSHRRMNVRSKPRSARIRRTDEASAGVAA